MTVVTEHYPKPKQLDVTNQQRANLFPIISKAKCIRKSFWLIRQV